MRSPVLSLLLALVPLGAACLPEAGPGIGQQRLHERGLANLDWRQPDGTGGSRLLFTRPDVDATAVPATFERRDLFALVETAAPHPLMTDYYGGPLWDSQGRAYLLRDFPAAAGQAPAPAGAELVRAGADLTSTISLGRVQSIALAPDRTRMRYQRDDGAVVARGPGDADVILGDRLKEPAYVGGDLYFIDGDRWNRLAAGAAAVEPLVASVTDWRPLPDGRALLIERGTSGRSRLQPWPGDGPPLAEVTLASPPALSPDGARVAFLESGSPPKLHVLALATGVELRSAELAMTTSSGSAAGTRIAAEIAFRPGGGDVWCALPSGVYVVPATGPVVTLPNFAFAAGITPSPDPPTLEIAVGRFTPPTGPPFTADGQRWFYRDASGTFGLGSADDPLTGATLALGQDVAGTAVELAGGRLAVWVRPESSRWDVWLIDHGALTIDAIVGDVVQSVTGADRLVAIVRPLSHDGLSPGDLVIVDAASGAETILARNATEFTLSRACDGCDPTLPGTPLAYVVHARVPWTYDGLWTAPLP